MSAVDDVRSWLVAQGLVEGSTGWTCTRRRVHDGSDRLVVLTDDGGSPPTGVTSTSGLGEAVLLDEGVQVRVRAEEWDADAAQTKAAAIFADLNGASGTLGDTTYMRVVAQTSQPIFIGYDDRGRPEFTVTFSMMR